MVTVADVTVVARHGGRTSWWSHVMVVARQWWSHVNGGRTSMVVPRHGGRTSMVVALRLRTFVNVAVVAESHVNVGRSGRREPPTRRKVWRATCTEESVESHLHGGKCGGHMRAVRCATHAKAVSRLYDRIALRHGSAMGKLQW